MTKKIALITGITGQDGAYLCQLLLQKGYRVHGIIRRSSSSNLTRLESVLGNAAEEVADLTLHYGDLTDSCNLAHLIGSLRPDELYNLAAQSHVKVSFESPEYTANVDGTGTLRLLEAIRLHGLQNKTRFYQASTSELYGKVVETPQSETTPFYPRSPYGVAKLYSYWITVNYREAYGIHASNGILFNHESPVRGETFVTRKITLSVAAIAAGSQQPLRLGNLDAKRDWGHARDYVRGMWLMLQQDKPDDYVLATGELHSVREFVERSFAYAGKGIIWRGEEADEIGICAKTGRTLVEVDPAHYRPTEVELLLGNPSKANSKFAWRHEYSFDQLVQEMTLSDMAATGAAPDRAHFKILREAGKGRRP